MNCIKDIIGRMRKANKDKQTERQRQTTITEERYTEENPAKELNKELKRQTE